MCLWAVESIILNQQEDIMNSLTRAQNNILYTLHQSGASSPYPFNDAVVRALEGMGLIYRTSAIVWLTREGRKIASSIQGLMIDSRWEE
jgi:hypothetical protein